MPYNYAQTMLSDQTSSCSHQVHGMLISNALSNPLGLLVCFFFVLKQNGWVTLNIPFSVFGLSTLILYSGTNCVGVFKILKDNRCFSYFR